MKGNAKRIQEKNLPIFSATTQNDGIIEWQRSVEACRLLGLSESNDTYLDTEENVIKGPSIGKKLKQPWTSLSKNLNPIY